MNSCIIDPWGVYYCQLPLTYCLLLIWPLTCWFPGPTSSVSWSCSNSCWELWRNDFSPVPLIAHRRSEVTCPSGSHDSYSWLHWSPPGHMTATHCFIGLRLGHMTATHHFIGLHLGQMMATHHLIGLHLGHMTATHHLIGLHLGQMMATHESTQSYIGLMSGQMSDCMIGCTGSESFLLQVTVGRRRVMFPHWVTRLITRLMKRIMMKDGVIVIGTMINQAADLSVCQPN